MKKLIAQVAVPALLLAGCSATAASDRLTIVATVYPLAWVAGEIAPDAEIISLAAEGTDPHDQELSPQQRGQLEQADVVLYMGDIGFQPQVERAVAHDRKGVVDVEQVLGDRLRPLAPSEDDEHAEDEEHGENDEHAEDAAVIDPHFWFDAELVSEVATAVAAAASSADPANADAYRAAAERVRRDLAASADEVAALLDSCRHDTVIVSHEAFVYLLAPHGLTQRGISGAGGHSEASPADIANLVDTIREQQLTAVLTEPVEGRQDAEVVAREAGVELIDIYSLDVVHEAQSDKGFVQLLREQAQAVATAAECGA